MLLSFLTSHRVQTQRILWFYHTQSTLLLLPGEFVDRRVTRFAVAETLLKRILVVMAMLQFVDGILRMGCIPHCFTCFSLS